MYKKNCSFEGCKLLPEKLGMAYDPLPKTLTLFMNKILGALNISYEGLLLPVLLIMMKK